MVYLRESGSPLAPEVMALAAPPVAGCEPDYSLRHHRMRGRRRPQQQPLAV